MILIDLQRPFSTGRICTHWPDKYFEQCAAAGQPHITAGANGYKKPSTQLLRESDQCSKFTCVHAIIVYC